MPVLSVYLDLDAARFPTPAARAAELTALVQEARRQAKGSKGSLHDELSAGIDRMSRLLTADPAIASGARSPAIFAMAGSDVIDVVAVPMVLEPLAVIDTVPWLDPLAGALTSDAWGVVVLGRRTARLFRGGPAALVEFASLEDEVHRRHAQGGWSQARFQRGIEAEVAAMYAALRSCCLVPIGDVPLVTWRSSRPASSGRYWKPPCPVTCDHASPASCRQTFTARPQRRSCAPSRPCLGAPNANGNGCSWPGWTRRSAPGAPPSPGSMR
jgi:hypothetical protein